jgi:Uma2 family endonuclease
MATQRQPKFITPEEYIESQRTAEFRSEYIFGEVFEMSAASRRHGEIIVNAASELLSIL